ncbi:MAG: hypothetical protein ABJB09_06860 [Verrucomicrobiota bacterium]
MPRKGKMVEEETEALAELMLHAEQFCCKAEARSADLAPNRDEKEFRRKLGLCRCQLAYLQSILNDNELVIDNPQVRDGFRHLITALMWLAFYANAAIDFRLYRMVIMIESSFTHLLLESISRYTHKGNG